MKIRVEKPGKSVKNQILIGSDIAFVEKLTVLSKEEKSYVLKQLKNKKESAYINRLDYGVIILCLEQKEHETSWQYAERWRKAGGSLPPKFDQEQIKEVLLHSSIQDSLSLSFLEGLLLGHYQFLKYKSDPKPHMLETCYWDGGDSNKVEQLSLLSEAVCYARDLVNEPLSFLTAEQLSAEMEKSAKASGLQIKVLNKEAIKKEKMGGLLAVNKGAPNPPTFTVLEWNPDNAKNSQPLVFVGKGVVYDTGGLSLKPTANSMDLMKSDMGGAAAVAGLMQAVAKARLPLHIIGLVPATENRPGLDAYAPGDIIEMHDGTKVEVLNTDAEGRMILADALSYAKRYKPERVINLATLTGAAAYAIGSYGIVAMGDFDEEEKMLLDDCGKTTYERLAFFPFWEEYGDLIQSDIADIKNLGGPVGGAITAGKFLKHFTDYPFMHFDIAGPAYLIKAEAYKPAGGTGSGIRILFEYLNRKSHV